MQSEESNGNGNHSKPTGLSVSLAGSDGRVLGGGVAGMLVTASPMQVRSSFISLYPHTDTRTMFFTKKKS